MRGRRVAWFLGMIVIGVVIGLAFGWVIHPINSSQAASLEKLRTDYQTDYVLMVAETYHSDHNLAQASQRLSLLSRQSPTRTAADALKAAQSLGYAVSDLDQMVQLADALQAAATPTPGVTP